MGYSTQPQQKHAGTSENYIFATLGLHLGFSAKLRIWQVPTCKMEPRSGMIIDLLTTHPPATARSKIFCNGVNYLGDV